MEAAKRFPLAVPEIQEWSTYTTELREKGGQEAAAKVYNLAKTGNREGLEAELENNRQLIDTLGDRGLTVDRIKEMDTEQIADLAAGVYRQTGGDVATLTGEQKLTPYQQADIEIKRENQDIRRLEAETKKQDAITRAAKSEDARRAAADKASRLAEEYEEKKRAKYVREAKALDSTTDAIDAIGRALSHPGLDTATGSLISYTYPGSKASDFEALLDSVHGINFTQIAAELGGLSGLTEIEGKKLGDAAAALNIKASPELMRSELTRIYERLLNERDKGFGRLSERPEGEEQYTLRRTEIERKREEEALARKQKELEIKRKQESFREGIQEPAPPVEVQTPRSTGAINFEEPKDYGGLWQ